ncbi:MAG TPA: mechanosensitive ion channel family protein [Agriterribacter sp.]|nr:mechanosensitive ion channel family protein [Agriterribacter sp.]
MKNILEQQFWNNTILAWIIAVGIIILSFFAIRLFRYIILRKIKAWSLHTATTWDDFLVITIENSVIPILNASAVYFALSTLALPEKIKKVVHVAFLVVVTFFVLRTITAAFRKFIFSFIQRQENSEAKKKQANGLIIIVSAVIWVLGFIFLINNLGYNVTTLIAGLGIGGIAIALAAQAILGDLFSYFVIFFDRPFEIGDFIIVDDKSGIIEYIGIKTTRIRTLNGEQLICSNTDLTNARVHNFKRLEKRRIVFTLGVTYQTTHQQLAQIPAIIKGIIEKQDKVQFDRAHFSGYGDFSLNFESVYYVLDADYSVYMDKQQDIYLAIYAAFGSKGIEFAYPTQTLFVQRETNGSVAPQGSRKNENTYS